MVRGTDRTAAKYRGVSLEEGDYDGLRTLVQEGVARVIFYMQMYPRSTHRLLRTFSSEALEIARKDSDRPL